ncbi:MAG: hypothetical protein OXE79_02255 [Acidimicrobiaceae bacterium]|nr:hypothetical protein [Acidimicrobiaceae bacterium]MCY4175271.1 hypothetical protein [Acidimicrobiaceae bacterium]MCY4279225.1 hypothetical protein [Acidimicrobiaceae bacterium]MCY4293751.1 hypothetical protein [Acidimicrobiaceae bacterium]
MRASEQQIDDWADAAWHRTTVEQIEDPEGFVAECAEAPGALAFGRTEQQARDEMRTVLLDWAQLRVARGHGLPRISGTVHAASM